MGDWYGASLLTLADYDAEQIGQLLTLAQRLKAERREGLRPQRLKGYSVALLFGKPSTRTRCAFSTALAEEGAAAVALESSDLHISGRETMEDTARVFGRMFDAIAVRFPQHTVIEILDAESGSIPVYNALSDRYHPTQALADLMTLIEILQSRDHPTAYPMAPIASADFDLLTSAKIAYVGDARNNVATSLRIACHRIGVELRIAAPRALWPADIDSSSTQGPLRNDGWVEQKLLISEDPAAAVADVDAVYTDVWASMGEEAHYEERRALLERYRVDSALMERAGTQAYFLHCLPAIRGDEVSAEVIDGPRSFVWEQAENRKHTIKALLLATLSPSTS